MAYVKCDCGFTKDHVPEKYSGKRFKCPECKTLLNIKNTHKGTPDKNAPVPPPVPPRGHKENIPFLKPKRPLSQFSILKDFKHIRLGPTYIVNFIRVDGVFLVPFVFALLVGTLNSAGGPGNFSFPSLSLAISFLFFILLAPIEIPLVYLFLNFLREKGVPFVGIANLLMCIPLIIFGDPLLYIIRKIKPDLVQVKDLSIFNFTGAIFILDETFE